MERSASPEEAIFAAIVADALDAIGLRRQALDPSIRPLAAGSRLVGRALPVAIEQTEAVAEPPYERQIQVLEALQPGDVAVLAVEPGTRAAMWGELFSCAAIGAGAVGVVTDGLVRDVRQIVELGFPVFATGASPLDTLGRAEVVEVGGEVRCGGVSVTRGDLLVADDDGAVVVPAEAVEDVTARVREKLAKELSGRDDLLAGTSVREVWERYGVF